ncbi:hypothetical protein ACFLS1_07355 [Verrucomicrobiota bacterium]
MKMRLSMVPILGAFLLLFSGFAVTQAQDDDFPGGQHNGEQKQLSVDISFFDQYGHTVTDESGTYYHVWGYTFYENKVYSPEYWGIFPLYFFGTKVGVTVDVTNLGPRNIAKLRVRNSVYCLNTDGSNGVELNQEQETDIDVNKGETKTIDASFVSDYVAGAESGLDRFLVKILHPNNGGGPGNPDPALIMVKEGIFCPPENEGEILDVLTQILGE